jgi:hypothetical protein
MLYNSKSIIHNFKSLTGRDFHEWKQILLSKEHNDRLSAYKYMTENGMTSYIDFLLWASSSSLKYLKPNNRLLPGEEAHYEFLNGVADDIYKSKTGDNDFRLEFHDNGNFLKIDWWSLAIDDEDEHSIEIRKENVRHLAKILDVNVSDISSAIRNKFPGRNCIKEIAAFLDSNNIGYGYSRY